MFRSIRTVAIVGAAVTTAAAVLLVVVPASASPSPTPVISSFSPTKAAVGTVVTIEGSNLTGATAVDFNLDVPAPVSANSSTEITTTVPLGDDNGPITVTTPGGTARSVQVFTLQGFYVATTSLPTATGGTPYSVQLRAAGGVGPDRWAKTGHLPKGLTLSRGGVLSGLPSLAKAPPGTYSFIVHVRDSTKRHHLKASGALSLTLVAPS